MKLKQACRFRAESGYGIAAQSAGFTAKQDEEMGKLFNSSMAPLFPKLGQSVFTCAVGEYGSVFLAKSTLRTDGLRTMIFTHAYVLDHGDYETLMEQNSAAQLLFLSVEDMLSTQPPSAEMADLSLDAADGMVPDLGQLREKYRLDDARYAQLLLGAYRAITTSGSLCLHTNRPLEETPTLVRELAFCIAEGLLPMLKGRLTYSSAADARMKVCVSSATGGQPVGRANIHFAVEPGIPVAPVKADPMSSAFFRALAQSTALERHALLDQMQRWLSDLSEGSEGTSLGLIVAAYYLSSGQKLHNEEAARLLSSVLNGARGGGTNQQALNRVLIQLLDILYAGRACPNTLPQLVERSLCSPDAPYDEAVRRIIGLAPESACAELVDALIRLPDQSLSNIKPTVAALLHRISPQGETLAGPLGARIIVWALTWDVTELNQWAVHLAACRPPDEQKELAANILKQAEGHALSSCASELLLALLKGLCRCSASGQAVCLDQTYCAMLDTRFPALSAAGQDVLLDYFFSVRLPQVSDPVDTLRQLQAVHPLFFEAVENRLKEPAFGQRALWEAYQTAALLPDGLDFLQLSDICRRHNTTATFLGSGGPFEQRVVQLWLACLQRELAPYPNLQSRLDVLLNAQPLLQSLSLSRALREEVSARSVVLFWAGVPYRVLFSATIDLPSEWMAGDDESVRKKVRVLRCVQAIHKNPQDLDLMLELIFYSGGQYSGAERAEFRKGLFDLTVLLVKEQQFLSWDLLLIRSYGLDKEDDAAGYHCGMVADDVARMEARGLFPPELHAPLAQSALLQKDAALRREMRKAIGHKSPRVLQELGEELKSDIRMPWQRGKAPEATAAEDPASSTKPADEGGGRSAVSNFFQTLFSRKGQSDPPPDRGGASQYKGGPSGHGSGKKGGKRLK